MSPCHHRHSQGKEHPSTHIIPFDEAVALAQVLLHLCGLQDGVQHGHGPADVLLSYQKQEQLAVHSSLAPSPLSLPLTWQGVLPWPLLASESKQALISQPSLGGAGTGRRGAMNLHCKSTALQASRASPKVTQRKAGDGWRARGHKHPPSLREGSTPWSCAGEAPGSVNFRNSTSLNALLTKYRHCQKRSNCFSSCGYGAAQLWLQADCPLHATAQMSQETNSFLALDRFHFWGRSVHCPVLNSFPFSYGLF